MPQKSRPTIGLHAPIKLNYINQLQDLFYEFLGARLFGLLVRGIKKDLVILRNGPTSSIT